MRKLIPAAMAALMAGLLIAAPAVLADNGNDNDQGRQFTPIISGSQFSEAMANTAFTQGAVVSDRAGNHWYNDSVYTGTLSGTPIGSGTFRVDANFFTAANASTSSVAGTFVDTDTSGNTITADFSGTVDSSNNATGNFVIRSGTGSYANIRGQGSFSGPISNASNTGTTTFTGQWAIVTGADADHGGTRPGNGFGDKNHVHTGPPGHGDKDD